MAEQLGWTDRTERHAAPEHRPRTRLRLKHKGRHTGYVDDAWWPHSDDLAAEVPELLAVLSVRPGPIARVLCKIIDWTRTPVKLGTSGRTVRLDGYRMQPANTIEVLGLKEARSS